MTPICLYTLCRSTSPYTSLCPCTSLYIYMPPIHLYAPVHPSYICTSPYINTPQVHVPSYVLTLPICPYVPYIHTPPIHPYAPMSLYPIHLYAPPLSISSQFNTPSCLYTLYLYKLFNCRPIIWLISTTVGHMQCPVLFLVTLHNVHISKMLYITQRHPILICTIYSSKTQKNSKNMGRHMYLFNSAHRKSVLLPYKLYMGQLPPSDAILQLPITCLGQ